MPTVLVVQRIKDQGPSGKGLKVSIRTCGGILTITDYALEEFQLDDEERVADERPLETLHLIVDPLHSLMWSV